MIVQTHPSARRRRLCRSLLPLLVCVLAAGGCGSDVYQSAPVNADTAREVLTGTLESWKEGNAIDAMQKETPPIIVQDLDWSAAAKLIDYEFVDDGEESGANLKVRVKLTLADGSGGQSEKTVTYVVGTSPKLTVFRDAIQ